MVHELIYCEDSKDYAEIQAALKAEYPDAVFTDASDYIHEYRFEFDSESAEMDKFVIFTVQKSFAFACFSINLMKYEEPKRLIELIKIARPDLAEKLCH